MDELKPCPFCGEIPRMVEHKFHGLSSTYGVECRCGVQGYQFYANPRLAANAWNSRNEEHRWTPVSEGLPDLLEEVIVTVRIKQLSGKELYGVCPFTFKGIENDNKGLWKDLMKNLEVVAWMPFPESYKGNKDENIG